MAPSMPSWPAVIERSSGVKLFTIAESEIAELQVGFKGTMNALFLKDLRPMRRLIHLKRLIFGFAARADWATV